MTPVIWWSSHTNTVSISVYDNVCINDKSVEIICRASIRCTQMVMLTITRSKLNTKCGRSPRFGRPSRSGDTGCWQNSLVAWRLPCLSRPGAHTSHHYEPAVNWSMAGGTCHPIHWLPHGPQCNFPMVPRAWQTGLYTMSPPSARRGC